jgi:glyceraldehyde 3-phosphate dehydrogenase
MLLKKDTTVEEINEVLRKTCKEPYYQGILACTDDELVSSDFIGNSHSGIVDLPTTNVVDGNLAKIAVWYDNEWGFSNRLVELVADIGKSL